MPASMSLSNRSCLVGLSILAGLVATSPTSALADGGVDFVDIASGDSAGVSYRRIASPRDAIFDALKAQPLYTFDDLVSTPIKGRGAPGIAMFDYDGDGDQDLYVTNGPGRGNSLYENQLDSLGVVEFVDVAAAAGVAATSQDSTGTCYGDIDNDGDQDLLVLGTAGPNRLFENNGDGTFEETGQLSDIGSSSYHSTTCSFGDVDGDGLLDVLVANTYGSWDQQGAIFVEPFAQNEPNELFINQGDGLFSDQAASSGILDTTGFSGPFDGSNTITWAAALIDIDRDGDLDMVQADDQAAFPNAAGGGIDRGVLHLFENDGTGFFTDVSVSAGLNKQGQWMSLAFSDLNCDGAMDIFGGNLGDYMFLPLDPSYELGASSSRWFLGQSDGSYTDPGVGALVSTPFSWGSGAADYDNDGDPDIIFHGGLDVGPFVEASNAGTFLRNQGCNADFVHDEEVLSGTNHRRRNVQGVAIGDLDNDGFADVVSVSNFDTPEPTPQVPYGVTYGSTFDDAALVPTFAPTGNPFEFVFTGIGVEEGTLSVELNSAGNGNGWLQIHTLGAVGLTDDGVVNRDGIGATVTVTPAGGVSASSPVHSGGTYASDHARTLGFGLGSASVAQVDVTWPGGVKNRLYGVNDGESIDFPEIPCSIDGGGSFNTYHKCVKGSLKDLRDAGAITNAQRKRFRLSAVIAWFAETYS